MFLFRTARSGSVLSLTHSVCANVSRHHWRSVSRVLVRARGVSSSLGRVRLGRLRALRQRTSHSCRGTYLPFIGYLSGPISP